MGTADEPPISHSSHTNSSIPDQSDATNAPNDSAPPAAGFVNHAFHLGLPRATGADTWGHAALWRNPAARGANNLEWERSPSVSNNNLHQLQPQPAPLQLTHHNAAATAAQARAAQIQQQQQQQPPPPPPQHHHIPTLPNHPAYAAHTQALLMVQQQQQNPLHHPRPDAQLPLQMQQQPTALPMPIPHPQSQPQPRSLPMQQPSPLPMTNNRRKQWSNHAPGQHTASRRGRNPRNGGNTAHGSINSTTQMNRSRGGGATGGGNSGGNANINGGSGGGGSAPSVREFNRRISACARRRDLNGALRVLDDLDRTPGVSRNLFTYNAVINALVMCAQHAKARELWTEMQESGIEPNLVTYNTMMKSCFGGTDDDVTRAFALVKEMEERGISADRVTLNSLINACVTAGLLREAQRVYEQMRARDIEPDDFTFTTLAKAGASQNNVAMLDALLVHQLHHHSTARNRAIAENADAEQQQVQQQSQTPPSQQQVVRVLNNNSGSNGSQSSSNNKNSTTHRTSPVAYNTIADAYIRCGHPERALRLLSRLKDLHILQRNIDAAAGTCDPLDGETIPVHPDVQTFNVILKALREAGAPAADAFQLLHQLKILGLEADHITLLTLADLCCRREEMALAEGVLHAATEADVREFEKGSSEWRSLCMRNSGRDVQRNYQRNGGSGGGANSSLHNSHHNNAVNVPGTSSGRRNVNQPRNAKANAALFNALIRGYSSLDPPNVDAAVALYREMQRYLEVYGFTWYAADFVTYTMLVDGFARIGDAARAEAIISEMENAGRANVVAYNAYMKANRASGFKAAVLVLERMKRVGLRPDVVTYNTIIDLLCSEENGAALAEELVRVDMPRNGVRPDLLTFNTLIKGAARVRGSRSDAGAALGAAYRWLRELQARGLHPDEFTYQSMVSACAAAGDAPRALEFFRKVEAERAKRSGHPTEYGAVTSSVDDRLGAWSLSSPQPRKGVNGRLSRQRSASPPADSLREAGTVANGNSANGNRSGKDWMLLPHPAAYIALMRAFLTSNGKHGVDSVLLLRDEMITRGLELGRQGHTAVADAYAERGEFQKVEETLAEMLRKERGDRSAEQGLGPVHHCIRMKALCNADRLDEAIAILPEVKNADAAVFNVLITACARGKDVQRLTVVLRAMEEANVDPDAITSRAISGMMRNVAKTLRSYDEHFRNMITKFVVAQASQQQTKEGGSGTGALESARANAAEVPLDTLLNNMTLGAGGEDARASPKTHHGLYL